MAPEGESRNFGRGKCNLSGLCCKYLPMAGGCSLLGFSTYIMNPDILKRLFGTRHAIAANSLWFNGHLGIGLYLYSCRHMQYIPMYKRLLFTTFSTVIFNFGSVLFWAASKAVLPKNSTARTIVGVMSGLCFLIIGRGYLQEIDKNTRQDENFAH